MYGRMYLCRLFSRKKRNKVQTFVRKSNATILHVNGTFLSYFDVPKWLLFVFFTKSSYGRNNLNMTLDVRDALPSIARQKILECYLYLRITYSCG